jgi:hypothetical protein
VEQLHENLKAAEVEPKLTPGVMKKIDEERRKKKNEKTVPRVSAGQFSISPPGTAA